MNKKLVIFIAGIGLLFLGACSNKSEGQAGGCISNADCSSGEVCQNGQCVAEQDTVPPETVLTSTPPVLNNSSEATFEFTCSESSCKFECSLDNTGYYPCSSPHTLTGLANATHTFSVRAGDIAGNWDQSPATHSWSVDTVPPETELTYTPPETSHSSSARFDFTCNEASCSYECRIDNSDYTTCSNTIIYTGLANGPHRFSVRAKDTAGNTDRTEATYSWLVLVHDLWIRPKNLGTVPSARVTHTAVWTSTEMIVWGGQNVWFLGGVSTGGRYNPATDTWTPTSNTNAPQGRIGHTAVWTGTEMIIFGGTPRYGSVILNTGGRYNPATDTWTPTSTTDAPPMSWHTAVWTGTEMIAWGGSSGGRYNPITDTWTPVSNRMAPAGHWGYTAVWTGSEMIVWGGNSGSGIYDFQHFNTGGIYNPDNDTWTLIPDSISWDDFETGDLSKLSWVTGGVTNWTVQSNEKYEGNFAAQSGGYTTAGISYLEITLNLTNNAIIEFSYKTSLYKNVDFLRFKIDGNEIASWTDYRGWENAEFEVPAGTHTFRWELDKHYPTSNLWVWLDRIRWGYISANTPQARIRHTAVWTGSEMIIWGGESFISGNPVYFNSGGIFDPPSKQWTPTDTVNAPSPRSSHTAVWTGSEMIVWGGGDESNGATNTGGRYDPAGYLWRPTSTTNAPSARFGPTAVWTGSKMIVWGGTVDFHNSTNTGGRYDPNTDTWTSTFIPSSPESRFGSSVVWTGTEMIVWGGDANFVITNTGKRYNPATDTWAPMSTDGAPPGRYYHKAAWTGQDMLIWGGADGVYIPGRYNPATDSWLPISSYNAPTGTIPGVWTGQELIVWHDTGLRYNPRTDLWTPISNEGDPPIGSGEHSIVWTGYEMIVWGGWLTYSWNPSNQGGKYNPITDSWTPTSTIGAPEARAEHTAIWTGTEMIVWGGRINAYDRINTGGRYNPLTDTWISISTVNAPAPRYLHSAVWTGEEMIIWGGGVPEGYNPTSGGRYNPSTDIWTPVSTENAPAVTSLHFGVWTGSEMIVWYESDATGGIYIP